MACAMRRGSRVLGSISNCCDMRLWGSSFPSAPWGSGDAWGSKDILPSAPSTPYSCVYLGSWRAFSGLFDALCFSTGGCGSLLSAVEKILIGASLLFTLIFLLRPNVNVLPRNFYNRIFMMLLQSFESSVSYIAFLKPDKVLSGVGRLSVSIFLLWEDSFFLFPVIYTHYNNREDTHDRFKDAGT